MGAKGNNKKAPAKKPRAASSSSNTSAAAGNVTPDPLAHLGRIVPQVPSHGHSALDFAGTPASAAASVGPVATAAIPATVTAPAARKPTPGLINPKHDTVRAPKMKWTDANDRKLLLLTMGREITPGQYVKVAASFPENPTPKAIQERLTKLRAEQRIKVRDFDFTDAELDIHPVNPEDDDAEEEDNDDDDAAPPSKSKGKRPANDDARASSSRPTKKTKRAHQPTTEEGMQKPETEADLREKAMLSEETLAAFPINRPCDISTHALADLKRARNTRLLNMAAEFTYNANTMATGADELQYNHANLAQLVGEANRRARRQAAAAEEAEEEYLDEEAGEEDVKGEVENEDSDEEYEEDSEGHADLYD